MITDLVVFGILCMLRSSYVVLRSNCYIGFNQGN